MQGNNGEEGDEQPEATHRAERMVRKLREGKRVAAGPVFDDVRVVELQMDPAQTCSQLSQLSKRLTKMKSQMLPRYTS